MDYIPHLTGCALDLMDSMMDQLSCVFLKPMDRCEALENTGCGGFCRNIELNSSGAHCDVHGLRNTLDGLHFFPP